MNMTISCVSRIRLTRLDFILLHSYRNVCNFWCLPASMPCLQYKQGKGNMCLFQLCRNRKSIMNRLIDTTLIMQLLV